MAASDALTKLGELAEQRHRDPLVSIAGASALLTDASGLQLEAMVCEVIGLAQYELGHVSDAVTSLRRAVAVSVAHGWSDGEATSRAHLAISLLALGDGTGAEREIAAAEARSSPSTRGVVAARRAVLLHRTGRFSEALVAYQRALRWLEEFDDPVEAALVYLNRGILCAYQGNPAAAFDNLSKAERTFRDRDLPRLLAMATHNVGFALTRLGNLPDALSAFSRAESAFAALGNADRLIAVGEADRCEALLLAGLVAEARESATRAVAALDAVGDQAHLTEGRLLLGRALLAAGDYRAASVEATEAARRFTSAGRMPWAALARYVAVQAEVLESEDQAVAPKGLLRRCQRIAAELVAQGWPVESVHVRTFAGRLALALGRPAVAHAELSQAVAARRRGTADLRAEAWHATALLRLAEGDRGGAKRALNRGMTVVDEYRASLGATELRSHAASYGTDLARLGIRLALEGGRAVEVLRWAERWRAGALRRPAVRPPDDERLAATLTELRQAQAELRAAALEASVASPVDRSTGRESAAPSAARTAILRAGIAELERSVRSQTRQAHDDATATGRVDVGAIRTALGSRCLVEYISLEGHLHAVTVTGDRVRLHHLGAAPVEEEKRYLLFAIRRLWSSRATEFATQALADTAARLDEMLLGPLGIPPDAPLVIVPTGILHGLPWSALPSVATRPTTIAPSAALWLGDPEDRPGRRGDDTGARSVALIAGPQLPGADDEVRRLASVYPEARVLVGAAASAPAVLAALELADVAHLAAHGRFRADSPLFSSVLLADGPVTVYDLERLRRAPGTVILAACDAAASVVRAGDELLGTAAALIGLGVRTVVAPVMPVPDGTTAPFMIALHQRLQAGDPPAAALASAGVGQDQAVAGAFICVGCDDACDRDGGAHP